MDDVIDSVDSYETAVKITSEIEEILGKGDFRVKELTISGKHSDNLSISNLEEKVLGVCWNPVCDNLYFKVKLGRINISPDGNEVKFTKRIALSVVYLITWD